MKDQIAQVAQLFEKQKYKKALLILNKINKKQPDFASWHYTAACYFYEKKYAQADIYFAKALKLASQSSERIDILSSLAVTQVHLGKQDRAIKYYKDLLAIDDSITTSVHRDSLCRLASDKNDDQTIFDYAPKLLNWLEYARSGLYFLLKSHLNTPDNQKNIEHYLNKLHGEVQSYDSNHALLFFELVSSANNINYINDLADVLEKKFGHEKWFKQFKLQQNNQCNDKQVSSEIPEHRVVGGNQTLVALVDELLTHTESLGARYHPSLRIIEDNGALSVKVFEQTDPKQKLIEIPYRGLPLLADFDFKLDAQGRFVASPVENMRNPDATTTMALLQDIYNSADKISHWQQCFPFLALSSHPELLKKLCAAKPNISKIQRFLQLMEQHATDELTIMGFLGSRKMLFSQKDLNEYGIMTENAEEEGLLSVIDFLNHRVGSNPYLAREGKLSVAGPADTATQELFVHYNNYDPLMTYLFYGFVDVDAPYTYSIPITLSCLDGKLISIVDSTAKIKDEHVPEEIKHLSEFLPETSTQADGSIQLDKLMIPTTEESHLLRQVLAVVVKSIKTANDDLSADAIDREVMNLEKQVIAQNIAYWQEVQTLLDGAKQADSGQSETALADVETLVGCFKTHYQQYSAKFGISLF